VRAALLAGTEDPGITAARVRRRIAVGEAQRRLLTVGLVAASVILTAGFFLYYLVIAHGAPAVMTAAAQDHRREVIGKAVKKWRSVAGEIDALAAQQGIPANTVALLAAAGYRLDRARLCKLDGNIFMHLVYSDGTHEMSVFLRPSQGNRAPLRVSDLGAEHVVAVQSASMTVVCVAEESGAAMNLAKSALQSGDRL
jgi:hypothetical protein